jgi:hypothetical protein
MLHRSQSAPPEKRMETTLYTHANVGGGAARDLQCMCIRRLLPGLAVGIVGSSVGGPLASEMIMLSVIPAGNHEINCSCQWRDREARITCDRPLACRHPSAEEPRGPARFTKPTTSPGRTRTVATAHPGVRPDTPERPHGWSYPTDLSNIQPAWLPLWPVGMPTRRCRTRRQRNSCVAVTIVSRFEPSGT